MKADCRSTVTCLHSFSHRTLLTMIVVAAGLSSELGCSAKDPSPAEPGGATEEIVGRCGYEPTVARDAEEVLEVVQLRERGPMGTNSGPEYTLALVRSTVSNPVGPETLGYYLRKAGGTCQGDLLLGKGSVPDRGGAHFVAAVARSGEPAHSLLKDYILLNTSPLPNGEGSPDILSVNFSTGVLDGSVANRAGAPPPQDGGTACAYGPPVAAEGADVLDSSDFNERTPTGAAGATYSVSLVRTETANRVGPPTLRYYIRKTDSRCPAGDALLGKGSAPDRGGAHFIASVPHAGEAASSPLKNFVLLTTSPLANGEGSRNILFTDFSTGFVASH